MKKKAAKKKAARKSDKGMGALLGLLKERPELVHALVIDHAKVKRLLRSRAARQLVPGVNARKILLKRVAGGGGARPASICLRQTKAAPVTTFGPHPYCFGNTYLTISVCCRTTRAT